MESKKEVLLAERLDELMINKNLNCKYLAKELGIRDTTVCRWRNGQRLFHLQNALKLANYFNCSLDFLVGRSEDEIDFKPKDCPPFYPHLRKLMKNKNVKRADIHRDTGIKAFQFFDWKNGRDPHILLLIELADYLDITLDELVGRDR